MRQPLMISAAAALLVVLPLAGCTSSSSKNTASSTPPTTSSSPSTATSPDTGSSGTGSSSSTTPTVAPPAPATTLAPLTGRRTALAFDSRFLSALAMLKVVPGVVGQATQGTGPAGGTVYLPITGGRLVEAGSTISGQVTHAGGLSLTMNGTRLSFTNLVVDESRHVVTSTVLVNGKTAVRSVVLLELTGRARHTNSSGSTVISGETALLSAAAAKVLNTAFRSTAATTGLLIGTVTITATG